LKFSNQSDPGSTSEVLPPARSGRRWKKHGVTGPGRRSSSAWRVGTIFLLTVSSACTALIDRSAVQCRKDEDCVALKFSGHPICTNSVCVRSGLMPANCVSATPKTPEQFLNHCSTTALPDPEALTGDECLSFTAADGGVDDGPPADLVGPPLMDAGPTTTAPVVMEDPTLPACRNAERDSVVYLSGSSNFLALLAKIAPIIIDHTGLTPVFRTTDSCTGASSMYPCGPGSGQACSPDGFSLRDHFISDPPKGSGAAHAQYYDATGGHDCLLGGPTPVQVGESEIFAETCGLQKDDTHVRHTPGPILPIVFVVPKNSRQSVISAAAAREIFGNGGNVPPWTDPGFFYIRGPNTATTRLVGRAIGVPVPPNRFWGLDQGTAQKLDANLRVLTDPADAIRAIGLLGADTYDLDRLYLKALGFQANNQACAYAPDSTLGSLDKRNVRDGHYPVWGTLHFFTAVSQGAFLSAEAGKFVQLFLERPDELTDAFIKSSWIPECAMLVQHVTDLSDPSTDYPPVNPCGCYFDSRVSGKTPDGCTSCTGDQDCTTDPKKRTCSAHFCEAGPV
jgi:hypothetical protein